jgi:ribosomal protein S27AE
MLERVWAIVGHPMCKYFGELGVLSEGYQQIGIDSGTLLFMIDEDPTDADMERFAGDTGFCPHCGEEVWDEAYACPECGEVVEGMVSHQKLDHPSRRLTRKTVIVLVFFLILGMVGIAFRIF